MSALCVIITPLGGEATLVGATFVEKEIGMGWVGMWVGRESGATYSTSLRLLPIAVITALNKILRRNAGKKPIVDAFGIDKESIRISNNCAYVY
jgi:hypothetical protein